MVMMLLLLWLSLANIYRAEVDVIVVKRDSKPILSFIDASSVYAQATNPTWLEASEGTQGKRGLIARIQNCKNIVGKCAGCNGMEEKSSRLGFSEQLPNGGFRSITKDSIIFGPSNHLDNHGTEDPRILYNPKDKLYYLFYTAYNGHRATLDLATSLTPLVSSSWTRHGPIFQNLTINSKSGALLIGKSRNYLFWGDTTIKVATSNTLLSWPQSGGEVLIQPRVDFFDSRLVESGPPPLLLSSGDWLMLYNSAQLGWPVKNSTAYHVGWVILDGEDPTIVKQRSSQPLLSPEHDWEKGHAPYTCVAPNVVFLEAAYPMGNDRFRVFFGGADSVIGSAVIHVTDKSEVKRDNKHRQKHRLIDETLTLGNNRKVAANNKNKGEKKRKRDNGSNNKRKKVFGSSVAKAVPDLEVE